MSTDGYDLLRILNEENLMLWLDASNIDGNSNSLDNSPVQMEGLEWKWV